MESSKLNIEEDLECTICLEPSVSPIHSCCNGHIVCGFCSDRVKKCGICGQDRLLQDGFAERLSQKYAMTTRCKNFASGCKTPLKSTEMIAHSAVCEYRPIICVDGQVNTCRSVVVQMCEFVDHLKVYHKTEIAELNAINGEHEFSVSSLFLQNREKVARGYFLLCEKNGMYFLHNSKFLKRAYCWWITVLGGQTEADQYCYTTQLTTSSKNIELPLKKFPVLPFHKFNTFDKVVDSGQYVSMGYKKIEAVQENPLTPNEIRDIRFGFKILAKNPDSK